MPNLQSDRESNAGASARQGDDIHSPVDFLHAALEITQAVATGWQSLCLLYRVFFRKAATVVLNLQDEGFSVLTHPQPDFGGT